MSLRTLNSGNSGILLLMGNAGFISSTVVTRMVSLALVTFLAPMIEIDAGESRPKLYLVVVSGYEYADTHVHTYVHPLAHACTCTKCTYAF